MKRPFTYTTQRQIRKAFWEQHPEHEAYALKWQIKTMPQNRHNADTRQAFCDFIDRLAWNDDISDALANRATL